MDSLNSYSRPSLADRVSDFIDRPDHNGRVFYDRLLSACLFAIAFMVFFGGGSWGFLLLASGAHAFGVALAEPNATASGIATLLSGSVFIAGVVIVLISALTASVVLTFERIFYYVSRGSAR